jgi:hypothetical protein
MRVSLLLATVAALGLTSACDRDQGGGDKTSAIPEDKLPKSVAELDAQIRDAQDIVATSGEVILAARISSETVSQRAMSPDLRAFALSSVEAYRSLDEALTVAAGAAVLAPPPSELGQDTAARIEALSSADQTSVDALYLALQSDLLSQASKRLETYARDGAIEQIKVFASEALPQVRELNDKLDALSGQ